MVEATLIVFGAAGQVGRSLAALPAPPGWRLLAVDRATADITNPEQIAAVLAGIPLGAVVNLAAYTQVDRAESEPDAAFAINRDGAAIVARNAGSHGLPLIHLSTDYVFDGTQCPWVEDDATGPLGVYGASKLAGEHAVLAAHPRALILRTAWVFGPFGANFVKAILRRALAQRELEVVADQHGCPTPAPALAETIWALAQRLTTSERPDDFGIFHYCGNEPTTWHGFSQAILSEATALGCNVSRATPVSTTTYPAAARRPAWSVLDCGKLARRHGIASPSWRAAVRHLLPDILENL